MKNLWSKRKINILAVFDWDEVNGLMQMWKEYSTHPSVDPDTVAINLLNDVNTSPCILVVTKEGEPRGLVIGLIKEVKMQFKIGYLTLIRSKAKVITILERGIIIKQDTEISSDICEAIYVLMGDIGADFCHFACINETSIIRKAAREVFGKYLVEGGIEKRWYLNLPCSFDEFMRNLSPGIRRDVKWRGKKLKKLYPDTFAKSISPKKGQELDLYSEAIKVFKKTYQAKLGLSNFDSNYVKRKWEILKQLKKLIASVVYINQEPVAFGYGHMFKSTVYFEETGYDPIFKKAYIGEAVWIEIIKNAIESGGKVLDYGLGDSEKKRQFASSFYLEGHLTCWSTSKRARRLMAMKKYSIKINDLLRNSLKKIGIYERAKRLMRTI
uniref:GNAT family N-acetyltransferase n=1 Tax=candidate division CPR3 bacterium TaxID=2268181 RepID=A0A7V3JAE0_UNCC3